MYKIERNLSSESLTAFDTLIESVTFSTNNIRLGANGIERLSNYSHSRWFDWSADQRTAFKNAFGSETDKALVGWFLKFPANTGFLDLMTYWQDKIMAGNIIAYALNDNQRIWLNDTEILVNRGEGVKFSLKIPHEVKVSNSPQNWACVMQLGKV